MTTSLPKKNRKDWDEMSRQEKVSGIIGLVITGFIAIAIISSIFGNRNNSKASTTSDTAKQHSTTPAPSTTTTTTPTSTTSTNSKPVTPVAPVTPAAPAATVSQKNALSKAKDYLSYTSFSHDGLVDQLVYEQFSAADAT